MSFAGLWTQASRGLKSSFGLGEAGRSMIDSQHCVDVSMGESQLTVGVEERRIAPDGLVKELDGLTHISLVGHTLDSREKDRLGATVKVESSQVGRRRLLNRLLLVRRKLGLELIRDRPRNFALNGKDIRQLSVVGLGPHLRVVARID